MGIRTINLYIYICCRQLIRECGVVEDAAACYVEAMAKAHISCRNLSPIAFKSSTSKMSLVISPCGTLVLAVWWQANSFTGGNSKPKLAQILTAAIGNIVTCTRFLCKLNPILNVVNINR